MTPPRAAGVGALRRDTSFDGWGEPGSSPELSTTTRAMLAERLGPLEPSHGSSLEKFGLPSAAPLPRSLIEAAGGEGAISAQAEDRIRHAAGKSYPDLIRIRSGSLADAPDAVLAPPDGSAVADVLALCATERIAVVPFGGGTSVVGGVEPDRGSFERIVSLDLGAMRQVEVDSVSQTARLGPGLRGPEVEKALNEQGFTLGHFPQSYRYATVGGFAATRSAGQASSGYGRFDALVTELELTAPAGSLRTLSTPHTAAGPSLRELVLGSEGIFGVITDVGVRVRPEPSNKAYEAWFAPGFAEGIEIIRSLAQGGQCPDVIRLSDQDETQVSLALAGLEGIRRAGLDRYLKLRRRQGGSMLIVGWEGERESVGRRRELSRRMLRSGGAIPLGQGAGRSWARGRYEGPHLRDSLIGAGVLVDTLETAHAYSRIGELYDGVRAALSASMSAAGSGGLVMCHVSHAYRDGASLYFTFLTAARSGSEIEQWRAIKAAACDAIVAAGGTITHHHAVGRDHSPYMPAEVGEIGIDVIAGVKEKLDPVGIMNPGKLIPTGR